MLAAIKTYSSRCIQSVMSVSLGYDAVEVEILVCSALKTSASQLEQKFKPSFLGPLFLSLSH